MHDRSDAQKILDVMFEILSRVHERDRVPADRESVMSWAREQLSKSGINVRPMGSSHAVLQGSVTSEAEEALSFILTDFEFLHAGHDDRMRRIKWFMEAVGLKITKR